MYKPYDYSILLSMNTPTKAFFVGILYSSKVHRNRPSFIFLIMRKKCQKYRNKYYIDYSGILELIQLAKNMLTFSKNSI